ncbi:MAG: hypothetical protein ABR570_03525 [Burkholderiales bacterium]
MGPERKENLGASTEDELWAQQHEELLLTSKRLVVEMQALTAKAKELAAQHVQIVKAVKRGKS